MTGGDSGPSLFGFGCRHLRNGDRRPPSRCAWSFRPRARLPGRPGRGLAGVVGTGGRSPGVPLLGAASGTAGVCGSLAAGHRRTPRFPGGAALREPPFAGVSVESGPPLRGPYAAALPAPARACFRHGEILRADRYLEGFSGGNWMAVFAPRRYAGALVSRRPGNPFSRCPCLLTHLPAPSGACRSRSTGRARTFRWGRAPGELGNVQGSYLVDSASSHMLVSKIKPCMSKCKHFIL